MKRLLTTLSLMLAVLIGNTGVSYADQLSKLEIIHIVVGIIQPPIIQISIN